MNINALTTLVILSFSIVSFAQDGKTIGKCSFVGKEPEKCISMGNVTIYHDKKVQLISTNGGVNIWKGTGNVWIIYYKLKDVGKHKFIITGKVQTCFDF